MAKAKKQTNNWWQNRIVKYGEQAANQFLAHELNARRHPAKQRDALRGSLNAVGWVAPVIVSAKTGKILDGHARVEEALSQGEESPVPFVEVDVSENEERTILATFDPITGLATYEREALDALLREVDTGEAALQEMLSELAAKEGLYLDQAGTGEPADAEPQIDRAAELNKKWKVKPGDLWLIGSHRLLCGDSTNAEDVARVMGGENAAIVFTSPPYASQREYTIGQFDWDMTMDGVFLSVFDWLLPDASVLVNLGVTHKDGRVNRYWDDWITRMASAGNPLYGWYVWDQMCGLPGDWAGRLAPSFEFIFHFARLPRHTNKTVKSKHGGESTAKRTFRNTDGSLDVFTGNGQPVGLTKVADAVIRVNRQIGAIDAGDHPAMFSVDLPAYCIPVWTNAGERIYEPFAGSGTTLVAAQNLNRRCYGIEISPDYCAVILERMSQAFPDLEIKRDA